jgi:hypothetical protein
MKSNKADIEFLDCIDDDEQIFIEKYNEFFKDE